MNSCIEKVTPDDFADQPAFTIAIGKPKKNAQGKYTPQTYYTKEDHKLIACNDDLYKVITSHGIKLAEGATPEEVKAVKSQLGYFVPGGLISGGSDTEIKGSAYGKPENDIYTRRNGNIAPSGIASFDVDELSDLAYEKLTGGAAGLVGGGEGILDSYHGLAYETISSKPGARRLRLALFLNEAVAVADKAIVYAKIEQMIMREIGAERGEIQRTNKKGDVVNVPGWMMPDGFTAFDGTAPRETQLMYNPPAGDDWPIWMFDGERIDVNALPELDEGAMVRAQSVPNTGQWQAPENVSELAGYLVENDLAEWHDDKTLNVVCAYEEEHSSGEPGQITNSTVLKLDAIESRQRFTCSHHGCHAAGHWQGADVQARFARKLGVPEGIISRTFGNESAIHEFEQLEPLKPAVVPFDDDDGISVDIRGYQEISEDITPDNLDVKAWLNVDLNNPPGLVGDIVRAIDSTAHRELKPAAVAAALQIVATAAGIGKRRGLHGGKLALITLTIAESASGKEPAQNFIKSLFSHMKMVKYLAGAPRSDKDLIINAMTSDAVTLYPIDEAHQFMKSIGDSKSSEFKQALGALMLETATTSCLVLSGVHKREQEKELAAKRGNIAKLEKQLNALREKEKAAAGKAEPLPDGADLITSAEEFALITAIAGEREEADKIARVLAEGIKSPVCNFLMSSTPINFDAVVTNSDIASGMLGRAIVFRCEEGRKQLRRNGVKPFDATDFDTSNIISELRDISNSKEDLEEFFITEEAKQYLEDVFNFYESDKRLNAPIFGGLHARAVERINALCALLAMHSRLIDTEIVKYSHALFEESTSSIKALSKQNATSDIIMKIQHAILAKLKRGKVAHSELIRSLKRKANFSEAEQQAKLRNQPSPVEAALAVLLEAGVVVKVGKSYQLK